MTTNIQALTDLLQFHPATRGGTNCYYNDNANTDYKLAFRAVFNACKEIGTDGLVIGASLKENRYSNICVKTLVSGHFQVTAIGLREGLIDETPVLSGFPKLHDIHTVTLYLSAVNQVPWYNYILELKPQRVIFNPGTENPEFQDVLTQTGIEVMEDCTIIMVEGGRF